MAPALNFLLTNHVALGILGKRRFSRYVMIFDLKRFWQTGRTPYTAQLECDSGAFSWPGYQPIGAVNVTFVATPKEDSIELSLSVNALIGAECARCLDEIQRHFDLNRSWSLSENQLSGEDLELPINESGELDVIDLAFQELIMDVPPVLLRSTDCKGLCQVCGKANAAGCSCADADQNGSVDPRLAILNQLLK